VNTVKYGIVVISIALSQPRGGWDYGKVKGHFEVGGRILCLAGGEGRGELGITGGRLLLAVLLGGDSDVSADGRLMMLFTVAHSFVFLTSLDQKVSESNPYDAGGLLSSQALGESAFSRRRSQLHVGF
jgi:hypothetical protein